MAGELNELFWHLVARLVTRRGVREWLVEHATRHPYTKIIGPDGTVYMERGWIFNPYPADRSYRRVGWRDWLPSIRVHHILRPDTDRHAHDHPWNARTIVLDGWYEEERPYAYRAPHDSLFTRRGPDGRLRDVFIRNVGYTGRLLFGQFHRISEVSTGGVITLFFTWRFQGTWGFDVDGKKVPWREYLGEQA